MQETLTVEVECLGKILEGEGAIISTLPESEYASFGEALKQSVVRIEEPDCAACVDGRCVKCLRNGANEKIRPNKAGASVSTLIMMGTGDELFLTNLEDNTKTADDLYAASGDLQTYLGNRESGHVDCGAAMGAINHLRLMAGFEDDKPTIKAVKDLMKGEATHEDVGDFVKPIKDRAGRLADVFEKRGWNGAQYVDRIAENDPEAVEVLETSDGPLKGHCEDAVVIIDGPVDEDGRPLHNISKTLLKKLTGREVFKVNLNEHRRDSDKLGSHTKQKAQLMTASLMHLGGVYKGLGDGTHPVFIVRIAH